MTDEERARALVAPNSASEEFVRLAVAAFRAVRAPLEAERDKWKARVQDQNQLREDLAADFREEARHNRADVEAQLATAQAELRDLQAAADAATRWTRSSWAKMEAENIRQRERGIAWKAEAMAALEQAARVWELDPNASVGLNVEEAIDRLQADNARLTEERDEAREWVRKMVRETQELRCAFCGEMYPPGTPDANDEALSAHIHVCVKHPMRDVEAERDAAQATAAGLRDILAFISVSPLTPAHIRVQCDAAFDDTAALAASYTAAVRAPLEAEIARLEDECGSLRTHWCEDIGGLVICKEGRQAIQLRADLAAVRAQARKEIKLP
jgi:hypothetical protein